MNMKEGVIEDFDIEKDAKANGLKLIWDNWEIAYRVNDEIHINPIFKQKPKLLRWVYEHEKSHTHGFGFTDIFLDFAVHKTPIAYWKFILKHPKMILNSMMPVRFKKIKKEWNIFVDIYSIISWIFVLIALVLLHRFFYQSVYFFTIGLIFVVYMIVFVKIFPKYRLNKNKIMGEYNLVKTLFRMGKSFIKK